MPTYSFRKKIYHLISSKRYIIAGYIVRQPNQNPKLYISVLEEVFMKTIRSKINMFTSNIH